MIGGRRNREAQMRLTASCRCRTFGGDPAGPNAGQDREQKCVQHHPCCPQLLPETDEDPGELRLAKVVAPEKEYDLLRPPGLGGPDPPFAVGVTPRPAA